MDRPFSSNWESQTQTSSDAATCPSRIRGAEDASEACANSEEDKAVELLGRHCALSSNEMREALSTVKGHRDMRLEEWVDEALVRVALQQSTSVAIASAEDTLEKEVVILRDAMATSLRDYEEEQAKLMVSPLERSIPEILEFYKHGRILVKCLPYKWCMELLNGMDSRGDLVALLEEEKRCLRWYPCPGTHQYFEGIAQEFIHFMAPRQSNAKVSEFLKKKTEQVVLGYSGFPGAPGGTPRIFDTCEPESSQEIRVEIINLVDDDET